MSQVGYRVLTATDAEQALGILSREHVGVLISDIVMPGMNGVDLAHEAKRLRPGIKIMFMTGYAQRALDLAAMRLGRTLFKPVRAPEILQAVKSLVPA